MFLAFFLMAPSHVLFLAETIFSLRSTNPPLPPNYKIKMVTPIRLTSVSMFDEQEFV